MEYRRILKEANLWLGLETEQKTELQWELEYLAFCDFIVDKNEEYEINGKLLSETLRRKTNLQQ